LHAFFLFSVCRIVNLLESKTDRSLFMRYMVALGDPQHVRASLRAALAFLVSHSVPFNLIVRLEHYLPVDERALLPRHIAEFLLLFSPLVQGEQREMLVAVCAGRGSDAQWCAFINLLRASGGWKQPPPSG
jgi:hypothetical protein